MFISAIYTYNFIKNKELTHIISYDPLWKTLEQKEISQYYLLKSGLDNKTLDNLKKGKNILPLGKIICLHFSPKTVALSSHFPVNI